MLGVLSSSASAEKIKLKCQGVLEKIEGDFVGKVVDGIKLGDTVGFEEGLYVGKVVGVLVVGEVVGPKIGDFDGETVGSLKI